MVWLWCHMHIYFLAKVMHPSRAQNQKYKLVACIRLIYIYKNMCAKLQNVLTSFDIIALIKSQLVILGAFICATRSCAHIFFGICRHNLDITFRRSQTRILLILTGIIMIDH